MTNRQWRLTRMIGAIAMLAMTDFLIKVWISGWLAHGESISLVGEVFYLTNIYDTGMAFGLRMPDTIDWMTIIKTVIKTIFSIALIIVLLRDTLHRFRVSAAMILFGWIGIMLDRILLSKGRQGYLSMEYFHDNLITGSTISISFLLITIGWFIFLISVFTRFRDFRRIFVRNRANADRVSGE